MKLIREIWYDENNQKHIKETWEFETNPQPQIGYPIDPYPKPSKKNNLIYEPGDFCPHSLPNDIKIKFDPDDIKQQYEYEL